jgi:hypothetical protein
MNVSSAAGAAGTAQSLSETLESSTVLGGSLIKLNPVDGLFLRAEHLERIQTYARALATAVGRAGGAGVAYGYTAAIANGRLQLHGGLAIASSGQPLLLEFPAYVPLPSAETSGAKYFIVELVSGTVPTGSQEQVFGLLCDDPCAGGEQFRPYIAEGVRVRFRPVSLSLPDWSGEQFRSAVASAYFEEERRAMDSLLPTSERAANTHGKLDDEAWSTGTGVSDDEGVPIGLLLRDGGNWTLDAWAARRDRIGSPPERGWEMRTGRRPEDVFLAQVLQFQAQLADLGIPDAVRSSLRKALPYHLIELPPAGYLPVDPASVLSINEQVTKLLGPTVDVRFCSARPDEIGLALERAQHLDRIRLSSGANVSRPKVDVLVPDGAPSTRSSNSSVRFGEASVEIRPTESDADEAEHIYSGLVRLRQAPGDGVTLAFAGAGTSAVELDPVDGLWVDLQLASSPFEMRTDDTAIAQATLAAHQPRPRRKVAPGTVLQGVVLLGRLRCISVERAAETGLPTFEGEFRGKLTAHFGSKVFEPPVSASVRISLQRESSSTTVLKVDLAGPKLTETIEAHVEERPTGLWDVRIKTDEDGLGDLLGAAVSVDIGELPAADVPGSQARWDAERGLAALAETDLPLLAVNLLYAGAGPAGTEIAYSSAHDWVFFTRRHLLDCAPVIGPDTATIRLDVYVAEAAADDAASDMQLTPAGYVAQLTWGRDTHLLSVESDQILEQWRRFHPYVQPTQAHVWLGNLQAPAQVLVDQVTQRMGGTVAVVEETGQPPVPLTTGSSGALIVTVRSGSPGLRANGSRKRVSRSKRTDDG